MSTEGYTLQVRDDESGRRGIWTRLASDRLDIKSGREGDDCHVALVVGQPITAELIRNLEIALAHGRAPDVCYEETGALWTAEGSK